MKCPRCKNTMTCLLFSYVCERCNPSNSIIPASKKLVTEGIIPWPLGYTLQKGRLVSVWASKENFEMYCKIIDDDISQYEFYKVKVSNPTEGWIPYAVDPKGKNLDEQMTFCDARVESKNADGTVTVFANVYR